MAVKIRLQRHGKKGQPFYHIVIADARAARDGKFIEKIGTYNPITVPATIELDIDRACKWLKNGAQPTDTARSILSYKGAMLKHHLQIGVDKGAITQQVADEKLNVWLKQKEERIEKLKTERQNNKKAEAKKLLSQEEEVNKKREAEIAKKRQEALDAQKAKEEVVEEGAKGEETEVTSEKENIENPAENTESSEENTEAQA
ncbi:MAG: 30S ribosomal protein S16 [Bacteroidales bacterium]|jgi:small subunit ribosomal protein S16|nr:30S ribosomal protein S16 [Bacteroidales bacterium]